jgi:hypothetical protein
VFDVMATGWYPALDALMTTSISSPNEPASGVNVVPVTPGIVTPFRSQRYVAVTDVVFQTGATLSGDPTAPVPLMVSGPTVSSGPSQPMATLPVYSTEFTQPAFLAVTIARKRVPASPAASV